MYREQYEVIQSFGGNVISQWLQKIEGQLSGYVADCLEQQCEGKKQIMWVLPLSTS